MSVAIIYKYISVADDDLNFVEQEGKPEIVAGWHILNGLGKTVFALEGAFDQSIECVMRDVVCSMPTQDASIDQLLKDNNKLRSELPSRVIKGLAMSESASKKKKDVISSFDPEKQKLLSLFKFKVAVEHSDRVEIPLGYAKPVDESKLIVVAFVSCPLSLTKSAADDELTQLSSQEDLPGEFKKELELRDRWLEAFSTAWVLDVSIPVGKVSLTVLTVDTSLNNEEVADWSTYKLDSREVQTNQNRTLGVSAHVLTGPAVKIESAFSAADALSELKEDVAAWFNLQVQNLQSDLNFQTGAKCVWWEKNAERPFEPISSSGALALQRICLRWAVQVDPREHLLETAFGALVKIRVHAVLRDHQAYAGLERLRLRKTNLDRVYLQTGLPEADELMRKDNMDVVLVGTEGVLPRHTIYNAFALNPTDRTCTRLVKFLEQAGLCLMCDVYNSVMAVSAYAIDSDERKRLRLVLATEMKEALDYLWDRFDLDHVAGQDLGGKGVRSLAGGYQSLVKYIEAGAEHNEITIKMLSDLCEVLTGTRFLESANVQKFVSCAPLTDYSGLVNRILERLDYAVRPLQVAQKFESNVEDLFTDPLLAKLLEQAVVKTVNGRVYYAVTHA